MAHPPEVLRAAEYLVVGQAVRVSHECGEGKCMQVSRNPKGVGYWCHRCQDKGFLPIQRPLAERIAELTAAREAEWQARMSLALPMPAEYDPQQWPDKARVWLYKAGMSNDDIMAQGFYYNERLLRVVMPIRQGGELVYWQARGFDTAQSKYLNSPTPKDGLTVKYGMHHAGPLVLTEDNLSAWKVGRVCAAWSIMGTALPDKSLMEVVNTKRRVILMLDPDPAGQAGNASARKKLALLAVDTTIVVPPKDPKLLDRESICKLIAST